MSGGGWRRGATRDGGRDGVGPPESVRRGGLLFRPIEGLDEQQRRAAQQLPFDTASYCTLVHNRLRYERLAASGTVSRLNSDSQLIAFRTDLAFDSYSRTIDLLITEINTAEYIRKLDPESSSTPSHNSTTIVRVPYSPPPMPFKSE